MKKRMIVFLSVLCLFFSGCLAEKRKTAAKETSYANYYKLITDNTKVIDESLYYTLSTEISKVPDGTYRYYVIIDEPQIAMYNCVLMAVENDVLVGDAEKIMPSMGIFDSFSYCLIPGQVNSKQGFVKGLVISGESSEPTITLHIMVEWKDATGKTTTREFLARKLKYKD